MLYFLSVFFSFVAGDAIRGFDHSDCFTKNLLWTFSVRSAENFVVIFCDLPELQKSHFSHRSQVSPTQGLVHPHCSGSENLSDVQWYRQPRGGGPLEEVTSNSPLCGQDKSMLCLLASQMNDSASYICSPRIRRPEDMACCVKTILEFKPQTNESCENSAQHRQDLLLGSTGSIYCPSLGCQSGPKMTWYKNGQLLPGEKRNPIIVDEIYNFDQGMYICDYTQSDNVSSWTVRAVVQVRTVVEDTNLKPAILDPITDTVEVELGENLTLPCKVQFGFQRVPKHVIRWYIRESGQEWEISEFKEKRIKYTLKDEVIEHTVSLNITERDLSRKFVCFAQNSIGNTTQTIRLRKKRGNKRVVFLYILLGTIMTLVGLLVTSALLYIYWIEMVLLCRTYWSKDETLGDKKEFDAFVSYAKCSSFESEAASSLSEEHLALNLFPEVLENKYGYSLCLIERDVPPGGVYADDIVNIIKTSRRGIFILSPNYVNGPHVFELQAAVNLALVDQTLKLILIKFCDFQEPESLPHLVRKALRVLPTVAWKGLKSVHPNSKFWTQMCFHLPVKDSNRFMWNQLRIFPRDFLHWKGPSETETTGRSSQLREWQERPEEPLPLQPPGEEVPMGRTPCGDQAGTRLSVPSLSTEKA